MTLPNWITLARLALVIPYLALMEIPGAKWGAIALFVLASLSDWVDGYLARRLNAVSNLGTLLDPLVDKVLVTGALVALAARGAIPAWSVTAILAREFLVTGLRVLEAKAGVILPAGKLGKVKTACQMVALLALMWALAPAGGGLQPGWIADAGLGLYWLALALTGISGAQYLWAGRSLLSK